LDESHTTLGQSPSHQTVGGKTPVARLVHPVQVEDMLGFPAEVGQLGHGGLHAKGHFVLADARLDFGIDPFFGQDAVEAADLLDDLPLGALADAFGIADVVHRIAFGLEKNSLKPAG
jgi:hypothetical protein